MRRLLVLMCKVCSITYFSLLAVILISVVIVITCNEKGDLGKALVDYYDDVIYHLTEMKNRKY